MESKIDCTVTYLPFVGCTLDAVKQTEVRGQATTVAREIILKPAY